MIYPASDLSDYYKAMGYTVAYDNLPDAEVISFQTISIDPVSYEYDDSGAHSHAAIIQARILRKTHSDLLNAVNMITSDLDGKTVKLGDTSYDVFVNSVVYQGMRSTTAGLMRYAVVTIRLYYSED